MEDQTYHESIEKWRQEYEERLTRPDSWLSIAGLYWLTEGPNSFGSDPDHSVPMPPGSSPTYAGTFTLRDGQVTLRAAEGVQITINDQSITEHKFELDREEDSEWIILGRLKLAVIQRGDRFGLRIYDSQNPALETFPGTRWHPVREVYRLDARYVPFEEPKNLPIVSILGDLLELPCDGLVEFELDGATFQLHPATLDNGRLKFLFKDQTSGDTTYPSGRYLVADAPQDGMVLLDFNKAYNPPCAYTPYATCSLPPLENRLLVKVLAGELNFPSPA